MDFASSFERGLGEARHEVVALRRELETTDGDARERLLDRIAEVEERYQTQLTLVVVANELASATTRTDRLGVVFQTVINLIGCEEIAVLDTVGHADERRFFVTHSMGVDPTWLRGVNDAGRLGRLIRAGHLRMPGVGPSLAPVDPRLCAIVPMNDEEGVFSVALLYGLLPQKHGRLSDRDRTLLRLIHEFPPR